MKQTVSLFLLVLLSSLLVAQTGQKPAPNPATQKPPATGQQGVTIGGTRIPIPPLPAFHPQQPKRIELSNGVLIFLQEDHELPLIDGQIRIRGGARETPASKVGMMSVYGQAWRTGGTEQKTGDEFDDFLEARAAKVETSTGMDSTFLNWSCLKEDFNDAFAAAADLLQHPVFRQDKIDLAKRQIFGAISRRNDDVGGIASREANKLAYGRDNPFARSAEYATVASVTRDDLLEWHKRTVVGANLQIGVVGDFDSAQMEAALRRVLEPLPRGERVGAPQIEFNPAKAGVYFAAKEDVNQANIRLVTLSPLIRKDPDFFAVTVMDEAFLSGGFSARLTNYVRTVRGLAYDAGGGFSVPYDHPGVFEVSAETKSQSAVETVQAIYTALDDILAHPVTADELRRAKDAILNSFIFALDSKDKLLNQQMSYAFYGYPSDFLERYRAGVEKVTADDVTRVAQKYIHPKELAILIVGNDKEFDKPLSTLGQVNQLDISIPPPPSAQPAKPTTGSNAAAVSAADRAAARALMQKYVTFLGGPEKIASVKAAHETVDVNLNTPQGPATLKINELIVYPDKMRQVVTLPQGEITVVVSPASGFMSGPMGVQDLPPGMQNDNLDNLKRDHIRIAQRASEPDFKVVPAGEEKIGEVSTQSLIVEPDSLNLKLWIDPATGKLMRESYTGNTPEGPKQIVTDLSDWRAVDGLQHPFKAERSENGEHVQSVQLTSIELNPPVDPKVFEKPSEAARP